MRIYFQHYRHTKLVGGLSECFEFLYRNSSLKFHCNSGYFLSVTIIVPQTVSEHLEVGGSKNTFISSVCHKKVKNRWKVCYRYTANNLTMDSLYYTYIFLRVGRGGGGNSEKMDFVDLLNRSKEEKDNGPVKRNGKGGLSCLGTIYLR